MENMHTMIDGVVEAGKVMLESGSEIYRSEETMIRMANSFGLKNVEKFFNNSVFDQMNNKRKRFNPQSI